VRRVIEIAPMQQLDLCARGFARAAVVDHVMRQLPFFLNRHL